MSVGFSHSDTTDGNSKGILNTPLPTRKTGQRSLGQKDLYLTRYITPWARPSEITPEAWRWWVYNEPIAMICRETLIANILAMDWEIVPKESDQLDEQRYVIRHYTKLLENGGEYYGFDWTSLIEWIMTDLQDLPFGGAAEIGRRDDSPTGRVVWVKPLDAATLYPTLNKDYPVVQYYNNYQVVKFPNYAIARTYISPRTEIRYEGWGMAPPEKIYFALNMIYRGDKYYADLLLDIPPVGIMDLGDTSWDSAFQWIESFREMAVGGPSSFKIPVLAEHTTDAKFIPLGKAPNDIMYDRVTLRYAAIVAAGYGMTLSDIGLQATSASGQTLAGSIRDERKTRRTGFARIKKKIQHWVNSFLPETLEFKWIDLEGELNVELGRARLATATASKINIETRQFSPAEMRLQQMADGIITVNLPEKPPSDSEFPNEPGKSEDRPGLMGYPQSVATGGQGEVKLSTVYVDKSGHFDTHLKKFVTDIARDVGQVFTESSKGLSEDEMYLMRSMVDNSLFSEEDALGLVEIIKAMWKGKRWLRLTSEGLSKELEKLAEKAVALQVKSEYEDGASYDLDDELEKQKSLLHRVDWNKIANEFEDALNVGVKTFIGRSAVYLVSELLLSEKVVDSGDGDGYDIVEKTYRALSDGFDEHVSGYISIETSKLINKIIQESKNAGH